MLASPSVSMMTMEVLLSGTVFSSRALFSMLMPLSSPSLMLVTGTQRASWEGVHGARVEEFGTLGPAHVSKDPVCQYVVVLSKY